ncbi:MAG: Fic family protein [Gemmatimonadetes bacterium]|nr:Fic family protein [Gemmatimonadota bacterium]
MQSNETRPIWNPETGIEDLEVDSSDLSSSEIPGIKAIWTEQQERLKDKAQLSDFTEKLSREWAIETGILENLYEIDRGVTQTLIERGFQSELLSHGTTNKPGEFVIRLLRDQKEALEGVFAFVKNDRSLTTSYIKELHAVLLRNQHTTEGLDSQGRKTEVPLIKGDWKTQPNYPVRDGVMYSYCPPEQVGSEMDRLIEMHEAHICNGVSAEVQAAWLHHRFAQIHPFQDGNGRVVRAIASLVLVKEGLFPLVIRRDDRGRYLEVLEAADHGDLNPLVKLITRLQRDQFRKATQISEDLRREEDVQAVLDGLDKEARRIATEQRKAYRQVFEFASAIENNLENRLNAIRRDVLRPLRRIALQATAFVRRSDENSDHFYRAQIVEIAKEHIGYYASTSEYRSWVSLIMRWSRRGQLVFAIHGIGRPFNGSLICSPFLEFRDYDVSDEEREERQSNSTLIPVDEEGFIFFYNEDKERLLERFTPWRENVLKVVISELTQNL